MHKIHGQMESVICYIISSSGSSQLDIVLKTSGSLGMRLALIINSMLTPHLVKDRAAIEKVHAALCSAGPLKRLVTEL